MKTAVKERPARNRRVHEQRAVAVLRQFRQIYGAVRRHFRNVEAACGVSGSHAWMLREIVHEPGIGLTVLASRLSIHRSTASQLAQQLVDAKLVQKRRSTDDQRRIGLTATPQGLALLQRAPQPAEGLLPGALLALPDRTLESLHSGLGCILEQMGHSTVGDAETLLADL